MTLLGGGAGPGDLWGSLPTSSILWFCILAAQEMLTQCVRTLYVAEASAALVLQVLHQKYRQRRKVLELLRLALS